MKVLALASYPVEAASTRYRLAQFVEPLASKGIELTIKPFLSADLFKSLYRRDRLLRNGVGISRAIFRRMGDTLASRGYDVVLVQREAMLLGPPIVERLVTSLGKCPMVLDLDDATHVSYTSPTYGKLVSWLKWFQKTDELIDRSSIVVCGNRAIAEHVIARGRQATIIPTVVDLERFRPLEARTGEDVPILGWVGTHSTFPYLESIFPVLTELAKKRRFILKVVGAGVKQVDIPGVEVQNLEWELEREIKDFQSFDIGLYPIISGEWASGKSGFKAIQYMSVGIPFVVTPLAASAEIGIAGETHFSAVTTDEWFVALDRLIADSSLRKEMGKTGRRHATEFYSMPQQAEKLATALKTAVSGKGTS